MFHHGLRLVLVLAFVVGCAGSGDEPDVLATEPAAATANPTAVPAPPSPTPTVPPPTEAVPTMEPTEPPMPPPTPASTPTANPVIGEARATQNCPRLAGFGSSGQNALWRTVNDGVMGGLSSGGPTFDGASMVFAGETNTNGGGFSSVRLDLLPGTLDGYDSITVRAQTDGRTYKITFDDALKGRDRRISHQADLVFRPADQDGWQIARASFSDLRASLFGRAVDVAPFRSDLATEMGVMISDGLDGPFQIVIDWIDACPELPADS